MPDMKARLNGIYHIMLKFDFFFGLCLSIEIFGQTDELSTVLQNRTLSAVEGQKAVEATLKTMKSMYTIEEYNKFWNDTLKKAENYDLKPELPRKRKLPARFRDENDRVVEFPSTPKEHYQNIYFKSFELTIKSMEERFDEGFDMYITLQNLLIKAAKQEPFDDELEQILDFYNDDFDEHQLRTQMKTFSKNCQFEKDFAFEDLIVHFKNMEPGVRALLSQVCKVMKLILVLPATTAEAERCFSRLKLILTDLRSTLTQERLNHFMVMGLYPELVDKLDTNKIADEFISRCYDNTRTKQFGKIQM